MKMLILPLMMLSLVSACSKEEQQSYSSSTPVIVPPPPVSSDSFSYLALGDSYTIGQSVAELARYPVQATGLLRLDSISVGAPEIIARTGWTTADLISSLTTKSPRKLKYDFVSLLIGVNNQYQHLSQDKYRVEFTQLLNAAIAYAGNKPKKVFVLSIPDYSVTPFASGYNRDVIAREIDEFNAINKVITEAAACNYIEITASTREAANDPSLICSDGLHPSGKEYNKWAILLADAIKLSLK